MEKERIAVIHQEEIKNLEREIEIMNDRELQKYKPKVIQEQNELNLKIIQEQQEIKIQNELIIEEDFFKLQNQNRQLMIEAEVACDKRNEEIKIEKGLLLQKAMIFLDTQNQTGNAHSNFHGIAAASKIFHIADNTLRDNYIKHIIIVFYYSDRKCHEVT